MTDNLPNVTSLSLKDYEALVADGYNRIPVMREVLADLDTPLSTYRKLADGPYTYLFESVHGGEKWGRYSIIGLGCTEVLRVKGFDVEISRDNQVIESEKVANPLDYVESYRSRNRVPDLPGLPRFNGGLVGYFGYETVGYIEKKLEPVLEKHDVIGVPDILLMLSDDIVVFDNLRGALMIITHVVPSGAAAEEYDAALGRLDEIVSKLRAPGPQITDQASGREVSEEDFVSSMPEPEFHKAVNAIKEYVLAGDTMQVVISQRMTIDYEESPLDLYRALRYLNPSPYMYYLNLGDFYIVGSSPEILVRNEHDEEGRKVTVRPIAGTRRRGHTEAEDLALEEELLADPKEIAEHLMLIDLGRNDVGRVAKTSTVKLTDQMIVERYSHVMHIVSNVEAVLKEGMSSMDVLKAAFPAGTLSGAPKIRAMEIINDLEPVKRCIYGGAIGYLSWHDDMDTAIAIRTAVIKDGKLHVQAGAGVVADSVPRLEWKETMNKGRALFTAVAMVQKGLRPEDGS